ncbi:MAG: oligosaccharide flippase family protein [Hyphomicrobiaceae bacterium]
MQDPSTVNGPIPATGLVAYLHLRVRALLKDRLVRNVGWYGLAEFANRFTRLITTVVLARWLVPHDFGFAAIAITTFEVIRVLAQFGIGQAVIRAPAEQLGAMCATAHRASWFVCLLAFAVQIAAGAVIARITGHPDLFWMIAALAGVYLTLPFGQIQSFLIARANRLHIVAGIAVVQVAIDNLLTAALAIGGFGAWAVVLPKLIVAPIWVIGMRRGHAWTRDKSAGFAPMAPLLRFSLPVIGSELLVAARFNLDKVLVGAILGVEALGIYYFVFNAGLGFSLSLTSSLAASVYPHLAEIAGKPRELLARYDGLLWRAALPCAAIIALQASLALLYVPIVFGAGWDAVAWLVAVLCASAIPKPLFDSASQLLRAAGQPRTEFLASANLTAVSLAALAVALPYGLAMGVIAQSLAAIAFQIGIALAIRSSLAHQSTLAQSYPAGATS